LSVSVRARLFALTVALILVGGGAAGIWLETELTAYLEEQATKDLRHIAQTVAAVLADQREPLTYETADRIADRLSPAAEVRITIVAANGAVLGDSEFDGLALRELESHALRPEITQARAEGFGSSGRFSRSVETEMVYVAVLAQGLADPPVVRASRRLSSLREAVGTIRMLLAWAGVLLVFMAVAMSAGASWFLTRSLNRLLATARAVRADLADRAQNERLEAVLQGMNEPVLALDTEQVITLSNRAAAEVLGLTESPIGRALFDVVPVRELAALDFVGNGESPSSVEFELGHQRLLAQCTLQRDGSGSVLVLHDITGIRRLEKMRRDFVANVSHELRTPVAVLQANAETLLDGALEDPQVAEKLVEAIHRQTERLSNLIADLLDISRIEAGQYHLEREAVPVGELCRHGIEAMERPAAARRVTISLSGDLDLIVLADSKAAEQIVTNLLDNAIKYGRTGGHVTLRVRGEGGRVRFEVEDDGPGIDRKHHARLFERFYRVDKGRSRGMGGTGLGLSIVKHLVETMGGCLGYRAAEPRGSVFWFELPQAQEEAA
jgi:two-component system phosphate regulon sensor histidine kinase PhoR